LEGKMGKRGRPPQRPVGAGDYVVTAETAAVFQVYAAAHGGRPPLDLRRIQQLRQGEDPILKLPTDPASSGWGPDYDARVEVTHVDSIPPAIDVHVAAVAAARRAQAAHARSYTTAGCPAPLPNGTAVALPPLAVRDVSDLFVLPPAVAVVEEK
jgi:hypothetical protein